MVATIMCSHLVGYGAVSSRYVSSAPPPPPPPPTAAGGVYLSEVSDVLGGLRGIADVSEIL